MAYGLSWPLVEHLARSNIAYGDTRGTEDARTGGWMRSVDQRSRVAREQALSQAADGSIDATFAAGQTSRASVVYEGEWRVKKVDMGRRLGSWQDWWTVHGVDSQSFSSLSPRGAPCARKTLTLAHASAAIGYHSLKDSEAWLEAAQVMKSDWAAAGKRFLWWGGNELASRP